MTLSCTKPICWWSAILPIIMYFARKKKANEDDRQMLLMRHNYMASERSRMSKGLLPVPHFIQTDTDLLTAMEAINHSTGAWNSAETCLNASRWHERFRSQTTWRRYSAWEQDCILASIFSELSRSARCLASIKACSADARARMSALCWFSS